MDDSDENDLDNLVDRHVDDGGRGEYPEELQQDHDEPGEKEEEKRIVPVKVRTKNPQPKLNSERWIGEFMLMTTV